MAILIDGKAISERILREVSEEVALLKREKGVTPSLAVVLAGDDPASRVYIRNKKRACETCGIRSLEYFLPGDVTAAEITKLVDSLNADPGVTGILVQLPLPAGIDQGLIISAIDPRKDADCFHPLNMGRLFAGEGSLAPCTPCGIMELLRDVGYGDLSGLRCVMIGRSNIVGKPAALLMLRANGTVTVCHSRTENLPSITREADVLVCAVGKAGFLTADMVKPGAVVIDVGMNRGENGKLCGDADFESVSRVAGFITPVPGGVGPMTVAMLMKNTLKLAKAQSGG